MASKAPRFGAMLVFLALLALGVRELYVLATIVDNPIRGDIREYVAYAWNLVEHGVYGNTAPPNPPVADTYRMPGYPLLIALGMQLWPQEPTWSHLGGWYTFVLQVQVVLGAATSVLVALLARHWLSATWSIGAGLLLALWPHHIAATNTLLTEVIFGFLLVSALYCFARAWTTGRMAWWVLAGTAFGCAYLVNSIVLLFPPCLAALCWWHGRRRPGAIMLAVFLLPLLAVSMRNATVVDADRGSAYRATLNFVQGSWPDYHAAAPRERMGDPVAAWIIQEINVETATLRTDPRAGIRRILYRFEHAPFLYARWYASKPWLLFDWDIRIGNGGISFLAVRNSPFDRNAVLRGLTSAYRAINPVLTTIALAGALVLTFVGVRRPSTMPAAATAALALYFTVLHTVLQAEPRYAIAYRGLEAVLVMTALAMAWQWFQKKRDRAANSSGAMRSNRG